MKCEQVTIALLWHVTYNIFFQPILGRYLGLVYELLKPFAIFNCAVLACSLLLGTLRLDQLHLKGTLQS